MVASLVVVLGLVSSGSAVDKDWVGGGDNSWCDDSHWSPSGVPLPGDTAKSDDGTPAQGPIIGPGCDANVWSIELPGGTGQHMQITGGTLVVQNNWYWGQGSTDNGTITMSGGSDVTVNGWFRWGNQTDANGTVNITDGTTFYCGSYIQIGDDGSGVLNISGGTTDVNVGNLRIRTMTPFTSKGTFTMDGGMLYVRNEIALGYENGPDPNAIQIFFDDGYINCGSFGMETDDGNTIPFIMEFGENAVLEIRNNSQEQMQGYVNAGFITGQGGGEAPSVVIIGGSTFVGYGLVQAEASDPRPRSGTGNLCPNTVTISWTPGAYCVDDHNVYFGTSSPTASLLLTLR
jgi:hypothetical protein